MIQLLQINSVVNSGSTGRIAEEIGQLAVKNGWKSYIAYGRNERESQSEAIKIGNERDINWHGVQTRLFDRHGLGSTRATKKFIAKVETLKPDIIHLHNLHGYYINIRILFEYLARSKIPVVWTLHDCWPITGHCAYFSFVDCQKWRTQCGHCPQKRGYPASYGLDGSSQNYLLKKKVFTSIPSERMVLAVVSHWLDSVIGDSFLKEFPRKVIYNGIDTKKFSPKDSIELRNRFGIKGRIILLGVATNWSQRKGLADYLKLSKILRDDEIIILVGLRNDQIRNLPRNVIGVERTEDVDELASFYSMADIVCNFSVEETFGLTTVEGFACGTPGIVYNCTASPELITPETGFVVEQGNITEIRNAIDTIKSKGKSFYAESCRERAVKMFNKNERYAEYLELYDQMLSEKVNK
jgi:glycosyltransferase involved in cell wall biosynthesis